ncbi:hypothetical protein [Candidatus Coxiella mudrowiae]|nr:hypothetical protein [Candidatus Coxiella mudrowiae]
MQSGKQLLQLLNGIIDIAKTEQHQLPDQEVDFSPKLLLNELI